MRYSCLVIALLLFFKAMVVSSLQPGAPTSNDAAESRDMAQEQALRLTTSITRQRYCEADAEVDALQIHLKLRYTNTGQEPIILDKDSYSIFRAMVSHNPEEAEAKQYVTDIHYSIYLVREGKPRVYGETPDTSFVVLKPGDFYETEGAVTLTALRGDLKLRGHLEPGKYVLQVMPAPWNETESLAKKLRVRWRQCGILWYGNITSEPMPFDVVKDRRVINCEESDLPCE